MKHHSHKCRFILLIISLIITVGFTACVHEFPDPHKGGKEVVLNFKHDLSWLQHEITVTRAEQNAQARYHLQVFYEGIKEFPVLNKEFNSSDLERNDFTYSISLPEGSYKIYVWSDHSHAHNGKSMFYDSSDFEGIEYAGDYVGNHILREAYRGEASFTVEASLSNDYKVSVDIQMIRPLSHYEFRATDIAEFIEREAKSRGGLSSTSAKTPEDIKELLPEIDQYKVKMYYTGFMPSKFHNILDRPIDSKLGMSYEAKIKILSPEEASLGFDYVLVNGSASSIPVALEIYDPENKLIARTNSIYVPTKRGQSTIVRGRFLSSKATGGVGIDPGYNGDYNIEIR